MTKEQQNRTRSFGKRSLSVILAVILVLSTFAVMLSVTSLNAGAAISYWQVAGNFNDWENSLSNTAYRINGSIGSVTIAMTASSIKFKMVANENGNHWCGNSSGSITVGTESELSWDGGNDIECALPANTVSVTFTLSVKNGKNYVTATANTSGGSGGGSDSDLKFTAPINTSNSANNSGIFWADATYYDYLSDEELVNGWLKPVHAGTSNFNGAIDEWYPFYTFNRDIVKSVADSNSSWAKPLYFGNFCNTYNAYDTSHHPGVTNGYTDATNSYNVTRFDYAANNSNGVYDRYTSVQGLMGSTLTSTTRMLQTPDGTIAPYFDEDTLGDKARIVESKFPFRIKDMGTYTRYEFDSTNATDNVYFTWETSNGKTYPKYVNYGAGTDYGVKDGIKDFMNTDSGYGIFPFNNASSSYKGDRTNANDNLDYGFGIRMDVKFRVPSDTDVKFDFSGDDDLWMYITDETTKESQLILDMGGSHKESEGVVDFNNGVATVYKVDDPSQTNSDIWFMDQSNWGNIVMWAWDNDGNGEWYYADQSSNLYRFRDNLIGSSGNPLSSKTKFKVAKNTNWESESQEFNISDRAGKCSYTDNLNYTDTNHVVSGHCVESKNYFDFNVRHTYTMTIFYMERGLIESNCKMGFTLTPMGNNVIVSEVLNTTNVNKGLVNKVKQLSSFDFVPYENDSAVTSRSFTLGDGELSVFPDVFDTGSDIKIQQKTDANSYLSYTTDWEFYDNVNSVLLGSAYGGSTYKNHPTTTVNKELIDTVTNDTYDFAELEIDFENTPDVGSFSVVKEVSDNEDHSSETFPVTVYLKFADNDTFTPYTLYDSSGTTVIANQGTVDLVPDQPVTFTGIPKGTKVYVAEQNVDPDEYTVSYSHSSASPLTVSSSGGTITVTNTPVGTATQQITGTKTFDGEPYDGELFTFVLEGVARFNGDPNTVVDTSATHMETNLTTEGSFRFDQMTFESPGIYRYHVYEDLDALADIDDEEGTTYFNDILCNIKDYLITITVTRTGGELTASDPVIVAYTPSSGSQFTAADFTGTSVPLVFANETQDCVVNIEKTNAAGQALTFVDFAIYKVTDEEAEALKAMTDSAAYDWLKDKEPDYVESTYSGQAVFGDDDEKLPIYKEGYEGSDNPEYQQYALIEYGGNGAYALNKTVNIFSFPVMDKDQQPQYNLTFSYVNAPVKSPESGVSGVTAIVYTGLAFVAFSMVLLAAYVLFMKKKGYMFVRFKK